MPRKRMLDPAIWESEQAMSLNPRQFKAYIYLINHADDEGRVRINYTMLGSRVFPADWAEHGEHAEADIAHMDEIGLVQLYTDGVAIYLCHPNWQRYQTINKAKPSRLPSPDECGSDAVAVPYASGTATVAVPPNRREEKGREEKGKEENPNAGAREDPELLSLESGAVTKHWEEDGLEVQLYRAFEFEYQDLLPRPQQEADAINQLLKMARSRGDPAIILPGMMSVYKQLRDEDISTKGFWRKQPFLPSRMIANWAGIVEEAKDLQAEEEPF